MVCPCSACRPGCSGSPAAAMAAGCIHPGAMRGTPAAAGMPIAAHCCISCTTDGERSVLQDTATRGKNSRKRATGWLTLSTSLSAGLQYTRYVQYSGSLSLTGMLTICCCISQCWYMSRAICCSCGSCPAAITWGACRQGGWCSVRLSCQAPNRSWPVVACRWTHSRRQECPPAWPASVPAAAEQQSHRPASAHQRPATGGPWHLRALPAP